MTGASRMICHSRNAAQRAVGSQGPLAYTSKSRVRISSSRTGHTSNDTRTPARDSQQHEDVASCLLQCSEGPIRFSWITRRTVKQRTLDGFDEQRDTGCPEGCQQRDRQQLHQRGDLCC